MREVKPVRRMKAPCYLVKEVALTHPELLERLPARWRACRQAAAAAVLLAVVGAAAFGCERITPSATPTQEPLVCATAIPQVVSETSVLSFLDMSATQLVDPARITKPVVFISYLGSQYRKLRGMDDPRMDDPIDLYDAAAGVGIEYQEDTDGCLIYDYEAVAKPDKSIVYVLVLQTEPDFPSEDAREHIRRQVEDFLAWLKAEGTV